MSIYDEVRAERKRAHDKHGDTSMESQGITSLRRLAILTEEVGEVARVFNDARHRGDNGSPAMVSELRSELVQVAAVAAAWADAIPGPVGGDDTPQPATEAKQ